MRLFLFEVVLFDVLLLLALPFPRLLLVSLLLLLPMLQDERLFEVLVFLHRRRKEDSHVDDGVFLDIRVAQGPILGLLQSQKLILHVDPLIVLDFDEVFLVFMAFVVEVAQFPPVDPSIMPKSTFSALSCRAPNTDGFSALLLIERR